MTSTFNTEADTTDNGAVFIHAEFNADGQNWLITVSEGHWFGANVIATATFDTRRWVEFDDDVTGAFEQEVSEAFIRAFEQASN